ncbi:MAG: DUF2277 family protein [Thiohalomonadales bacterium]
MCRNIKTLFNFDPPATDKEIRVSAIQFVRKLSGSTRPSNDVFYYPDVMVVFNSVDPESLYQTEPTVLVEILSKSTEKKDRLEKLVS